MADKPSVFPHISPNRGRRHTQNLVVLRRQRSNGQYSLTIPSGVAKALRLERGDKFLVFIDRGDIVLRLNGDPK